jgi:hypothetical protein
MSTFNDILKCLDRNSLTEEEKDKLIAAIQEEKFGVNMCQQDIAVISELTSINMIISFSPFNTINN